MSKAEILSHPITNSLKNCARDGNVKKRTLFRSSRLKLHSSFRKTGVTELKITQVVHESCNTGGIRRKVLEKVVRDKLVGGLRQC